jgi:hypothetical protein
VIFLIYPHFRHFNWPAEDIIRLLHSGQNIGVRMCRHATLKCGCWFFRSAQDSSLSAVHYRQFPISTLFFILQ